MGVKQQIDERIKALLRATPQPGERPSDAYLRSLAELAALGSNTLTASGCSSAPSSEWTQMQDDRGKVRGILLGGKNGQHVIDGYLLAESGRVLKAIVEELLAWRDGRSVDEPAEVEDEPEESEEEASFAGRSLWGPGF